MSIIYKRLVKAQITLEDGQYLVAIPSESAFTYSDTFEGACKAAVEAAQVATGDDSVEVEFEHAGILFVVSGALTILAKDNGATAENGFLLDGRECYCDDDGRCENHDDEAAADHALSLYGGVRFAIDNDAYEPGDPKRTDYTESSNS